MTNGFVPTRRHVVGGLGIGAALLASGRVVPARAAPKPVTIGFIYVGPRDDYGYNQAHAEGAAGNWGKTPGTQLQQNKGQSGSVTLPP